MDKKEDLYESGEEEEIEELEEGEEVEEEEEEEEELEENNNDMVQFDSPIINAASAPKTNKDVKLNMVHTNTGFDDDGKKLWESASI